MTGLVNPEPDEAGEIGWPANADAPTDVSIPTEGSGGATAHEPEPSDPPTIEAVEGQIAEAGEFAEPEAVEEVPAEQPAE